MNIKQKLGMSMATGVLGIVLISGGTFAYFSDTVETTNKVTAGTLDLGITNINDEGVLFEFQNKKPGDVFDYTFSLTNDGSLDIKDVTLFSKHLVEDMDGEIINNDFGSQILVNSLMVNGKEFMHSETTLDDLQGSELKILKDFAAGDEEVDVYVQFEFLKTDSDQNMYQGNSLELKWIFEAMQTED